jgi:hypothetical protein
MRRAGILAAHLLGAALLVHGCAPDEPVDVDARVRELRVMGARGPEAVPDLLPSLRDRDARVRHAAAVALSHADPTHRGGVAVLVNGLDSEDWYTRWEACLALQRIGPPARAALPKLIGKLCDAESDISRESALALLSIAPEDAEVADALLMAMDSKRRVDKSAVRYALRKIGVPAPSEPPHRRHGQGHYYQGEYDDHYEDTCGEAETDADAEPAAESGLDFLGANLDEDALRRRRRQVHAALLATGAGDLARILRKRHDAVFGVLPAGFAPREREVYRKLRARLERGALDAKTVQALGEAVWRPKEYGHALLRYGGAEARAFAAALLGHIKFDYYRACEALRRAGRDTAPEVRAAAKAARERIEGPRR